jgi:hypothetical protein
MDKLPGLERLSEPEKDALIAALWAEVQRLQARLVALEGKLHEPRKDAHNSSVPPSHTPKANLATGPRTGMRRGAKSECIRFVHSRGSLRLLFRGESLDGGRDFGRIIHPGQLVQPRAVLA